MTGQCIVTGTLATWPGASIVAIFQAQGSGVPLARSSVTTLDANGVFSIQAWDNSHALYQPSLTKFILMSGGEQPSIYYAVTIPIAGSTMDISTQLSGAPTPPV